MEKIDKNLYNRIAEIVRRTINESLRRDNEDTSLDIESIFNFSSIPDSELMKQYVDLSFTVSSSGYGGKFMGEGTTIIAEEATSTMSIPETRNEMIRKFKLKDWQFGTNMGANGIELVVLYPGIFKNTKLIRKSMETLGWSLSVRGHIWKNKMLWRAMSFDPMFQDDVSSEARKYRNLYHWTPIYNLQSIEYYGLKPRSENRLFDYPDRIHLIKGNTPTNEIFNIGNQLCIANKTKKNDGKYILLSVDILGIPKDTKIYYDPRYDWGYYMKDGIQPSAIKPIFGYNFKTEDYFSIK